MKKQRKHYTPEEKVTILRRHPLEQVPICLTEILFVLCRDAVGLSHSIVCRNRADHQPQKDPPR